MPGQKKVLDLVCMKLPSPVGCEAGKEQVLYSPKQVLKDQMQENKATCKISWLDKARSGHVYPLYKVEISHQDLPCEFCPVQEIAWTNP